MRRTWALHAPTLAVFAVMLLVGGLYGLAFQDAGRAPGSGGPRTLVSAIELAGPDADGDTYPDHIDLWEGDAVLRWNFTSLTTDSGRPYLLVGTDDDHWRLGAGRELEWRHVVDPDPLDLGPGSQRWADAALRTGTWLQSVPGPDSPRAIADQSGLGPEGAPGAEWPLVLHLNVRDDGPVDVRIEVWDDRRGADARLAAWDVHVAVDGNWTATAAPGGRAQAGPAQAGHGTALALSAPRADLAGSVEWTTDLDASEKLALAQQWAPTLHFAAGEAFFPTRGDALERFHGFYSQPPDLRTWNLDFNNDRQGYLLLIADFDGDGITDHRDVAVLTDILRAGEFAPDTVYAHVTRTTGDRVVVQFWFIYMYNFVLDETDSDVPRLAHEGDREFVQLTFSDLAAARNGTPESVAYSQHYKGARLDRPSMASAPLQDGVHVYVARGSHASYPVPGDDAALRPSFAGFNDVFHGDGETWHPGNYTLEVLGNQTWHAAYSWGPITRHHRDIGTAGKPWLQHDFTYAFHDPVRWQQKLMVLDPDDLEDLYNSPERP